MLNYTNKRNMLLLSIVVVLIVAVGATIAYLISEPPVVVNKLEPATVSCEVVEDFDGLVKTNVAVKNTSNIDAYIRASVIVTWQDSDGNIYGKYPIKDTDYTIEYNLAEGWVYNEADGFYYYTEKVGYTEPDNVTSVLISNCAPAEGVEAPEGYTLCVEILASAIQAEGVSDGVGEPGSVAGESAVVNAWGVDPSTLA